MADLLIPSKLDRRGEPQNNTRDRALADLGPAA
jgi:hypothetical protein